MTEVHRHSFPLCQAFCGSSTIYNQLPCSCLPHTSSLYFRRNITITIISHLNLEHVHCNLISALYSDVRFTSIRRFSTNLPLREMGQMTLDDARLWLSVSLLIPYYQTLDEREKINIICCPSDRNRKFCSCFSLMINLLHTRIII